MERDNEIGFLKILCTISAIMSVGNNLAAVLSGSSEMAGGSDSLTKVVDALQDLMLPHRREDLDRKVEKYRDIMEGEHDKGPLKFHVVSEGKPKNRKRRFTKVR